MVGLSVLICLAILEGYARIWIARQALTFTVVEGRFYPLAGHPVPQHYTYDPVTGYALIPNIVDPKQQITTDENGFRITSRRIDPNKPSIIFVGDSTVFGWGVGDTQTYLYLLAQNPALMDYNVINMGVPSYSLGHDVAVIKNRCPRFNPKIVLVSILWPYKPFKSYSKHDAWKNIDYDFYRNRIPYRKQFEPTRSLRRLITPHLYLALRDVWGKLKFREQIQQNLTRPGVGDFTINRADEEQLALDHVKLLKEAVQPLLDQGVKVVFYIHPYQYTVFNDQYRNLGQWGRSIMIKALPALYPRDFLLKEFKGEPLFIDGCHLTPAGNEVFAKYFSGILEDSL